MDNLRSLVRLKEESFYQNPHPVFARMRQEAPVFWHEPGGFWALTRYEDVRFVARATDIFTVEQGVTLEDNLKPDRGRGVMPPGSENLLTTDPPRQTKLRRVVSGAFSPRMIAELEPRIRRFVTEAFDQMDPCAPVDLVGQLAGPIPLHTIAELLGVARHQRESFGRWADSLFETAYATAPERLEYLYTQLFEAWTWFGQALEARRETSSGDLISALLDAEVEGERLSDANLVMFCFALLAGGIETTRHVVAGSIKALADYPEQRAALLEHPEMIRNAVDELLRWTTPVMHTARTAKTDCTISGQAIAAGDYLLMLYPSANRDEEIWERAEQLDVTRKPDPMHVAFGFGAHLCIGASLARLEIQIMLEEFLRRHPKYEIATEPEPLESLMMSGFATMPVWLNGS